MPRLLEALHRGPPPPALHAAFLRRLTGGTVLIGVLALSTIALVQPALLSRALWAIVALLAIAGMTELLARTGHPRGASWCFILGIVGLISANAWRGGGVTSPGMRSLLVCVLMAGVLLGERAAIGIGVLASLIGMTFALLDLDGILPAHTIVYDPLAQWVLLTLYLGITVVLMRFFATSAHESLRHEAAAVTGEERAKEQLRAVLKASAIGVWSYHPASDSYLGDARVHEIFGSSADPAVPVPASLWRAQVEPGDLPALVAMLTRLSHHGGSETLGLCVHSTTGELHHVDITCFAELTATDAGADVTGLVHDRTAERLAEAARAEATAALGERVKELTLLHGASRLLRSERPLDTALLADLAAMIPPAFLHPDRTVARIRCGDLVASTPTWQEPSAILEQRLGFAESSGAIVVGLVGNGETANAFLPEERELLVSLAEKLEAFVEREQAERLRTSLEEQLRQSQKMKALGTLAGGIAHDFNNILTAVNGNIALARSEAGPDSPLEAPLAEIDRAAARAAELVRRILLFSRRQDAEMRPVQIAPIVGEVVRLLRAAAPANIEIDVRLAPNLPPLLGDEGQLHQALVNLGTNAIYAMGARQGTLTFELDTVTPEAADGLAPTIRLAVRDTGAGIEPGIRDRLFDPFFTTKGSAGTGLGLAVVHGVVQSHGGQITVDSTVGVGTTFTIELPGQLSGEPLPVPGERTVARGHGERIMYVDDEEAIVFVMMKMLRSIGYECEGYTSPLEALQAFRTTPHAFDAVVTDFSMPMMTGTLLARELERIRPSIPVVVSSGYTTEEIETGTGTGVGAVLPKPVSIVELSHCLANLLGRPELTTAASPP